MGNSDLIEEEPEKNQAVKYESSKRYTSAVLSLQPPSDILTQICNH